MLDRLHSTEDIAFMVCKVAGRQAMLHDFHSPHSGASFWPPGHILHFEGLQGLIGPRLPSYNRSHASEVWRSDGKRLLS